LPMKKLFKDIHIYFEKFYFLTFSKSKNKCLCKDLQVTFQGPDAPRVMIKALEMICKQLYFS